MPIDPSAPILAVDTSYAVFHKYFALRRWKILNETAKASTPDAADMSEPELLEFGDRFRQMLLERMRAFGVAGHNVVLMLDCPRAEIWRMAIFPEYKGSRKHQNDMPGNLFSFVRETLVPDLCESMGMTSIACPAAEADDIAAGLVRWAPSETQVTILSGDCDLAQLHRDNVRVVDMTGACLLTKATAKLGCPCDAERYLKIKILQGDKGDNIPSVKFRLGPKTATRLAADDDALAKFLMTDAENERKYELNRTLIDLDRAPAEIRDAILRALGGIPSPTPPCCGADVASGSKEPSPIK